MDRLERQDPMKRSMEKVGKFCPLLLAVHRALAGRQVSSPMRASPRKQWAYIIINMYRFNLVSLLPLLTSLVNYLSPEENESALITQLPFLPAPFPSKTYSSFIDISESKSIHYVLTESQDNP